MKIKYLCTSHAASNVTQSLSGYSCQAVESSIFVTFYNYYLLNH